MPEAATAQQTPAPLWRRSRPLPHAVHPPSSPPSPSQVRAYLLARGARVLGVEIEDGAVAVDAPGGGVFTGPTAFILGNEGSGLSKAQMAICDGFVYIPQYGPGTASLNVATAAGIVLHRFASWAGYAERPRTGNKFDVADRGVRTAPRGYVPEDDPDTLRRKCAIATDIRFRLSCSSLCCSWALLVMEE